MGHCDPLIKASNNLKPGKKRERERDNTYLFEYVTKVHA